MAALLCLVLLSGCASQTPSRLPASAGTGVLPVGTPASVAPTRSAGLAATASVTASASTGQSPPTPTAASPAPPPSPPSVATTASASPCTSAAARPAGPGTGVTSNGSIWTVASGLDQPDDLLYANGSLLVGVLGSGTIEVLAPGGTATTLPVHVSEVEGLAYVGTKLYVAGQAQDAVLEWLGGTQLRKVIQLNPVAGQAGVDGIGAGNGALLVPDSPRGVVDWVNPRTGAIEKQVGGFVRPTGAWTAPDGSVLIADEFGNAVVRLAPDGTRTYLVRNLPSVDDIAEDSRGAIFAVTAVAPEGRLVQLVDGSTRDLADGLQAPQGVTVDGADNLYVSESGAGRIDLLIRTFKLLPLRAGTRSSTGPVCIDIQRAVGFDDPITLQGSPGVQVVQQPGTGSRGAVLIVDCPQSSACGVTAISGTRRDVLQL